MSVIVVVIIISTSAAIGEIIMAEKHHSLALENGAKELSPFTKRNWGDHAAYSLDHDGHVLVFAKRSVDVI